MLDGRQFGWLSSSFRGHGSAVIKPGPHFKWPWQTVRYFDGRIQWREICLGERQTLDGGSILLAATASWRVVPDGLDRRATLPHGDAGLSTEIADALADGLDNVVAQQSLPQLLGTGPQDGLALWQLGRSVRDCCGPRLLDRYGIELLDVSVSRAGVPESIQAEMRQEELASLQAEADRRRTAAATQAADIRAQAEAEASRIKDKAMAEASSLRSEAQTQAAEIVAEARNPELESLARVIDKYRATADARTTLVLEGGKEFFRLIQVEPAPATQPAPSSTQGPPAPPTPPPKPPPPAPIAQTAPAPPAQDKPAQPPPHSPSTPPTPQSKPAAPPPQTRPSVNVAQSQPAALGPQTRPAAPTAQSAPAPPQAQSQPVSPDVQTRPAAQ